MRRAYAISLLATIGLSLIAPVVLLQPQANLPACCRRNGAHHCVMGTDGPEPDSGASFIARRVCSSFPAAMVSGPQPDVALAKPAAAILAAPLAQAFLALRMESPRPVASSRSHRKRGPPSLV